MTPELIISVVLGYFGILILVSWITSQNADKESFYLGNRSAHWLVVSFGMIGATLSGVTFISVPGAIGDVNGAMGQGSYIQVLIGYIIGYWIIASVLLPIYYRLNLTSIYGYLEERFGYFTRKTGASFFLLSRVIGASFRLYLVAKVLDYFVFNHWGVPFEVTIAITILFIFTYTYKSGIKTIIYTDTIQTLFMLLAVGLTTWHIIGSLGLESVSDYREAFAEVGITKVFFTEGTRAFWKQFLSGLFLALVMTGLDQDMMQKNLSCRNLKEAQKNMYTLSGTMTVVNLLFVLFGAVLTVYAFRNGLEVPLDPDTGSPNRDLMYPDMAINHFTPFIGILFILGLIAAAYSSADSAMTALTTSFMIDFLDSERKDGKVHTRRFVHFGFAVLIFTVIVVAWNYMDTSVITRIFQIAGLTYGPLLGLFSYGILTRRKVADRWVPLACMLALAVSTVLFLLTEKWFGYKIGFEILIYNGIITFALLLLTSFFPSDNDRKEATEALTCS